jgi:methionyl-tRNA formyltransferase
MRVVFFGSGEFAIPTLRSLRGDKHDIAAVVSQPDRPAGRGKALLPTPLKAYAESFELPVLTPPDVNAPDAVAAIRALRADLGYVAAFGQKIGPELLDMFSIGLINLHGSLLPAYRGAAPVQWAVLNGDDETGVTVFRLVPQMDAGPTFAQRRTAIGDAETADELHDRLARIGCDCLRGALERLAKNPKDPGDPQDTTRATRAPKLTKSDGAVDFNQPAARVVRRINGLWSWPGAACRFESADKKRSELVTLARAEPRDPCPARRDPPIPGRITADLAVETADGEFTLLEIKPANGRRMDWRSFVNGRHVAGGDCFVRTEATSGG